MVRPYLEAHIAAGLGMYDIARALDAQGGVMGRQPPLVVPDDAATRNQGT